EGSGSSFRKGMDFRGLETFGTGGQAPSGTQIRISNVPNTPIQRRFEIRASNFNRQFGRTELSWPLTADAPVGGADRRIGGFVAFGLAQFVEKIGQLDESSQSR